MDLLKESQAKGELRQDLDLEKTSFLLYSLLETILRSYYLDHLAGDRGLYRGDPETLDDWVRTTVDFIKNGLVNR